jgi:ABC-2 type transport system permease protein
MIISLLKKELLEAYRNKKVLILLVLFLFIAISSPIIAKLIPTIFKSLPTSGIQFTIPDPTYTDAIDQFIKNISQIGFIVMIFIFAGAVVEEKSKKTFEIVLTKPISRSNIILAKFKSAFLLILSGQALASIIFYAYTVSLFGTFSTTNFAMLSLFILIFLWLVTAITILASTIAGSQISAVALAFISEIVIISLAGYIKGISDYVPGYLFNNYKELMLKGNYLDFLPSVIVSLALILLSLIASIALFSKQEIER